MSEEVEFIDKSEGGEGHEVTEWHWNFGDDTTSIEQNPSHSYEYPGEYDVSLIVINDCDRNHASTQCINVGGDNMEHIVDVNVANGDAETIIVQDGVETKAYKFAGNISGDPKVGKTAELLTADGTTVLQTQTTDDVGIATFTDVAFGNYKLKITY